uniref:beta strand repeat-containing protein n=1 Tax=Rubinisphaera sp. JC750 TaxID=2898658 RepID=UPI001F3A1233
MALPSILAALLNRFSASPMPTYGAEQRENEPKSWLRSWFSRHRSPDLPAISTRRPLRPLGISRLEDRRVLSVSATVAVGSDLLTITGDGDADTVNILSDGTTLQLQDENGVIIQIDGNDDVLLADIANGINIDLGDGNDVLNLPVITGLSVTVVDGLGADTISLTGSDAVVGASFNGEAEVIELEGDLNFTAGIALTGDVTLQDSTTIDTGAASSIDGTLQGLVGTENFTLNAPGANWSFTGAVSQLGTFQISSAADVTFDSSVSVTTFTQQAGTGTTTFDALTADSISITTSDLVLNGAVEASVDALDITVDTIEVGDTITADAGINLLTATSTQAIELGGVTDTGTNFTLTEAELQFLSSTGVVTIGSASYTGDMTLNALDISSETYDLKLEGGAGSTVSVDGALTLGSNNFDIDPPSDVTINSAITAAGAGSVTIEAINEILFENSGSITTDAGTITLTSDNLITFAQSGAAVLTTSGGVINVTSDADDNATGETRINANSTFTTGAGAGNITLTGDVTSGTPDTFTLTLTAGLGNVVFTDAVGDLNQLQVTSAASVDLQGTVDGLGTINLTSSGFVDFDSSVSDVTTLTVDAGGNVNFRDTVDQVTTLTANVTGVTRFDGDLSNIGTLTTNAAGSTVINTSVIGVTDATFNDAVTIEQSLVITAGNDVTFDAAVNGDVGTETLTVNATNDLTFGSTVNDLASLTANVTGVTRFDGDLSNIGTLTTNAAGSTVVNAAVIGVTDATFNDSITLEQNLVIT